MFYVHFLGAFFLIHTFVIWKFFSKFRPKNDSKILLGEKKPGTFNEQLRSDIPDAFGYILLVLDGTLYFGGWYSNYSIFSVPLMLYIVHVHVVDHDDGITCVPPPHPHHVKKTKKEMFQKKNNQHSSDVFRRSRTWRYNAKIQ